MVRCLTHLLSHSASLIHMGSTSTNDAGELERKSKEREREREREKREITQRACESTLTDMPYERRYRSGKLDKCQQQKTQRHEQPAVTYYFIRVSVSPLPKA
jgi:hypothetical protein